MFLIDFSRHLILSIKIIWYYTHRYYLFKKNIKNKIYVKPVNCKDKKYFIKTIQLSSTYSTAAFQSHGGNV